MLSRRKTGSPTRSRPSAWLAAAVLGSLAALSAAPAQAAAVEFFAVADKQEVGLDDVVTLTVTLSTAAGSDEEDEVRLPEAPDFQVLSRSQSQQMSFAMGQGGPPSFRRVRVYTIVLQPLRTGVFTIQPGRLVHDGRRHETGAIQIKVVAGNGRSAARPSPGGSGTGRGGPGAMPGSPFGLPPGLFDDDSERLLEQFFGSARPTNDSDLYLRNLLDKKQAWLGEQLTLSTYLFSRVEVSGVDGFKMPRLDGFWAEDLETPSQITGELRHIDGIPYRVFLLRKRALFPLKAGKLTIDPVEVDVATGFGLMFSSRKVHRASQPLTVEVQPLPAGAPAGFEAANVGLWRLTSSASPTTVALGQPVTLTVTLEGTGNLASVALPKLPSIPGFKSYDPTTTQKTSSARGRWGGTRTLEYLLMPEQTGAFEIPALSFVYFNPATKQYETASSESLRLRVEAPSGVAGAPGPSAGATATPGPSPGALNLLGAAGLRPLRFKGTLTRPSPPVYRSPYFWPIAAVPFLAWIGLGAFGFVRSSLARGDPHARRRKAAALARKRLRKAEALARAGDAAAFYADVSRSLHELLSSKLGAPVVGMTRTELESRLRESGAGEPTLEALWRVLDACDAGRFAPGGAERATLERVHAEAREAMELIEGLRPPAGGAA